jgi:hypothetical protein
LQGAQLIKYRNKFTFLTVKKFSCFYWNQKIMRCLCFHYDPVLNHFIVFLGIILVMSFRIILGRANVFPLGFQTRTSWNSNLPPY